MVGWRRRGRAEDEVVVMVGVAIATLAALAGAAQRQLGRDVAEDDRGAGADDQGAQLSLGVLLSVVRLDDRADPGLEELEGDPLEQHERRAAEAAREGRVGLAERVLE